ncbi:MAG: TIGR03808 family TAT-translocated repetitive protein [Roseiarcus sp.]
MTISRRRTIGGAVAVAGAALLPIARSRGEELGSGVDATAALRRAIDAATRAGRPFIMGAGTLHTATLHLADGARLIGLPGATRLALVGGGPLIAADGGARVTLSGLTFDGADRPLESDRGLLDFSNVGGLSISECAIEHSGGVGLRLRGCGGWIERNGVRDIAAGGVFSTDATGLVIADNRVERCGDNGVQVWRSTRGDDGTRVSGNRISDIKAVSGGAGQYGNGVSIFRAGGVLVTNNTIRRCTYTAVRNNGGAGVVISDNSCAELGETAIFAEFEFEGCVISNNSIDGAVCGVQMVNFADHGGRAAVCSGNVIRGVRPTDNHSGHESGYECAVKVEADATVSANVIEGAPWVGILVGWGASLRDVAVLGNVVRNAPIGIGVSIAQGAGSAAIADNIIAGASRGAILGMNFDQPVTADLAGGAAAPPQLRISGNQPT